MPLNNEDKQRPSNAAVRMTSPQWGPVRSILCLCAGAITASFGIFFEIRPVNGHTGPTIEIVIGCVIMVLAWRKWKK